MEYNAESGRDTWVHRIALIVFHPWISSAVLWITAMA